MAVIFPRCAERGEFPVFFFSLTSRFPRFASYIHWCDKYILGYDSSKDEWPPSLLSLHPSQGELYYYWANEANHDARCSSNRICLTRWWSMCQSASLNDYWATGPFSDIASGVVFIKASSVVPEIRLKSATALDLSCIYPHGIYIWIERG